MAMNTERSKAMNKLKQAAKGGWKEASTAAARAKGSQLPGGIINGVAQLSSWKMDEDKNGNVYFMITGICVEPSVHAGARVQLSHFISETKKQTIQDKLNALSSDLQLLGGVTQGTDLDEVPPILDQLVGERRHFKFNTWRRDKEGDTMIFVQGAAPDWDTDPGDASAGEAVEHSDPDEPVDPDQPEAELEPEPEPEPEPEAAWEPVDGEVYKYKGKQVQIVSVNHEDQTVKAKVVGTKSAYPALAWSLLESA